MKSGRRWYRRGKDWIEQQTWLVLVIYAEAPPETDAPPDPPAEAPTEPLGTGKGWTRSRSGGEREISSTASREVNQAQATPTELERLTSKTRLDRSVDVPVSSERSRHKCLDLRLDLPR